MAAQILPFRSLVPAAAAKPTVLKTVNGPTYDLYSPKSSPKVLVMSNYSRRHQLRDSVELSRTMFAKAQRELAEGYLEVELTGLSFRRLISAYPVLVRGAWAYTMGSLRSLLRPTAVH